MLFKIISLPTSIPHKRRSVNAEIKSPPAAAAAAAKRPVPHFAVQTHGHPMRGATANSKSSYQIHYHFNPRTPCGVRRDAVGDAVRDQRISIHAPHAGCDDYNYLRGAYTSIFQSTHPMRGATLFVDRLLHFCQHFNPRTPCGVRPLLPQPAKPNLHISIHAPHAGCDIQYARTAVERDGFQSTHPMRGATHLTTSGFPSKTHFNPRTPCGVRLYGAMFSSAQR